MSAPVAYSLNIMTLLQKIQQKIHTRDYYLSSHAEDEMMADDLERKDLEHAILTGRIEKKLTRDIRGTRYRIEGTAYDNRRIHVICRFHETKSLIIITVYAC